MKTTTRKGIYERIAETLAVLQRCQHGRYELQRTHFFPFRREPLGRTDNELQAKTLCELIPECRIFDRQTGHIWLNVDLGWVPAPEIDAGRHLYVPALQRKSGT